MHLRACRPKTQSASVGTFLFVMRNLEHGQQIDVSRWDMFGWMLTGGCLKLVAINSKQVATLNQELLDAWFVAFFIFCWFSRSGCFLCPCLLFCYSNSLLFSCCFYIIWLLYPLPGFPCFLFAFFCFAFVSAFFHIYIYIFWF